MKQSTLIRRLARATGQSPAAAADQLQLAVSQILSRVRAGKSAALPGLGLFQAGQDKQPEFIKTARRAPR